MALAIYFDVKNMPADRYDEVMKRLADAGAANPPGRLYHAAFGDPSGLQVFDVWDSKESFEAFGPTLMPILGSLGIDPGQPMPAAIHNIVVPTSV